MSKPLVHKEVRQNRHERHRMSIIVKPWGFYEYIEGFPFGSDCMDYTRTERRLLQAPRQGFKSDL